MSAGEIPFARSDFNFQPDLRHGSQTANPAHERGMSNAELISYIVMPAAIFVLRITDVSVGTLRIIFISRRHPVWATLAGFIEVLIWLLAITQVFGNLSNWASYAAFAGGYTAGTFVGVWIEEWLAVGLVVVRIIPLDGGDKLVRHLREQRFGVTVTDGAGSRGPVKVIFAVVKRRDLQMVLNAVKQFNPRAFFTISDVRTAVRGNFPDAVRSAATNRAPAEPGPTG